MVLGNLTPGFGDGSGNLHKSDNLSTGVKPWNVGNREISGVKDIARLPDKVTYSNVLASAKKSGDNESRSYLLAQYSKNLLTQAQALADAHKTRTEHAIGMAKIDQSLVRDRARLTKAGLRYALNVGQTRENLAGWEQNFNNALASLD